MPGRKVAVITGASAGVGRATVRAFAGHGFDVGLLARGAAGLEAIAVLAALQGGLLLAKVERDVRPLDAALDVMISLIASLAPAGQGDHEVEAG